MQVVLEAQLPGHGLAGNGETVGPPPDENLLGLTIQKAERQLSDAYGNTKKPNIPIPQEPNTPSPKSICTSVLESSRTATTRVMEIPELIDAVAFFLDTDTAKSFRLVCKNYGLIAARVVFQNGIALPMNDWALDIVRNIIKNSGSRLPIKSITLYQFFLLIPANPDHRAELERATRRGDQIILRQAPLSARDNFHPDNSHFLGSSTGTLRNFEHICQVLSGVTEVNVGQPWPRPGVSGTNRRGWSLFYQFRSIDGLWHPLFRLCSLDIRCPKFAIKALTSLSDDTFTANIQTLQFRRIPYDARLLNTLLKKLANLTALEINWARTDDALERSAINNLNRVLRLRSLHIHSYPCDVSILLGFVTKHRATLQELGLGRFHLRHGNWGHFFEGLRQVTFERKLKCIFFTSILQPGHLGADMNAMIGIGIFLTNTFANWGDLFEMSQDGRWLAKEIDPKGRYAVNRMSVRGRVDDLENGGRISIAL